MNDLSQPDVLLEGVDYVIGNHPKIKDPNWSAVTILKEGYNGIVVQFGKLGFGQAHDDGTLDCSFDYDIIELAGHDLMKLSADKKFSNLLGDVVMNILWEDLKSEEGTVEENDNTNNLDDYLGEPIEE